MPILHNSIIPAAADDSTPADPVTRSLRLVGPASSSSSNQSETCNLKRTFSSAGNRKTYTVAFWVKRSSISNSNQILFSSGGTGDSNTNQISFRDNDTLEFYLYPSTSMSRLATAARFRDVGAWYHITVAVDTTQATAANRVKMFVNGVQQTFETHTTYPDQNDQSHFNDNREHKFGEEQHRNRYNAEVLLADCYFIDGSAIEPVDNFIEDTGYSSYKPKAFDMSSYSGNSFHIDAQPAHDADLLVTSVARNDGDTTFADAAAGHTLTTGGDPEHSIAVGNPFTGDDRAIYFDGSDDYIETDSSSDLTFGTGDFTVEFWFNPASTNTSNSYKGIICDEVYGGTGGWGLSQRDDELSLWIKNTGGSWVSFVADGALTANRWQHIAVSYDSSITTTRLFVDGTSVASGTTSGWSLTGERVRVGRTLSTQEVTGYLFDIRVTKGQARHTSSFTPPASKLTADSDTKLLIQPDKDDTGFHDLSDSDHTVTATSTPTITASTPYDATAKSTAMYFDGSGDYLQTPSDSIFAIGTSETFTAECWVYFKSNPASNNYMGILSTYNTSSVLGWIIENAGGYWSVYDNSGNRQTTSTAVTTGVWHHVALVKNSSTAGDSSLYLNGNRLQTCTVSSNAAAARKLTIGGIYASTNYNLNGYIFDARYAKGETKYSGSTYTVPSAPFELNPVYLGGDQSGNKNHFTPTGISAAHDVMLDTPTKKAGTNGSDPSEGNLSLVGGSNPSKAFSSTIAASSGKYYAEFYLSSLGYPSVSVSDTSLWVSNYGSGRVEGNGSITYDIVSAATTGQYFINSTTGGSALGIPPAAGDIIQVAFDADTRKVWFGRNGTWNGSGNPANGTNHVGAVGGTDALTIVLRSESGTTIAGFGADPTFAGNKTSGQDTSQAEFYYAPPTGFKSLNTSNLGTPTVNPSEYFNTVLWAGSGSQDNDISGVGFQPNFTWVKNRTSSREHALHDSVRGAGKELRSNSTNTESDKSTMFGPFQSDGFRLAESSVGGAYNDSGNNYVAWNWKESASAGFDIVTYEGDSEYEDDTQDISHGLGVAPEMIIIKARDGRAYSDYYAEDNWYVWHKGLTSGHSINLNYNVGEVDYSEYGTEPISSVGSSTFTVCNSVDYDNYYYDFTNWGDPDYSYTGDNERYVAYLFSGVEGFSKFGTYEGNNNANGPFIYCGFRPSWIMTKRIDGTSSWAIIDAARDQHNDTDKTLASELSLAESSFSTSADFDILSNGFKIRHSTSNGYSNSADTHIFAAFAESPFKYANAR